MWPESSLAAEASFDLQGGERNDFYTATQNTFYGRILLFFFTDNHFSISHLIESSGENYKLYVSS